MVERKLKGVWERERWHREAERSKREKKRVWESGDGEAEKEWLSVKIKLYLNRDERER